MNNEEKILEILEKHDKVLDGIMNRLDRLESTQGEMQETLTRVVATQGEMQGTLTRVVATQGEMQETLTRVAVTQEGVVLPKLQLLFEGQENLRQTLAPKERVEVLEDEVVTLKTMVKMIGKRLAALEQAQ
ncbi:MAG: hypothetical protein HFF73_15225 [Oscillospiraceae bacterium]|nr:hypothetical protein [Oscillospiraceae bacterium]